MKEDGTTNWRALVGKRVLLRRSPPWSDEPIREVIVSEVTPAGFVRLEFIVVGDRGQAEAKGSRDWYDPKEWLFLEELPG